MYHIELRQFPHNLCRFNLHEHELRAIVEPWMREPWLELGERKWNPHQARLTVLEGPQLPLEQLTMGRGWRAAQRQSEDVTERVLVAAKPAVSEPSQTLARGAPPDVALVADSLALELLALLGDGPAPLAQAWWLSATRFPERSPSECLALAEGAVRSLLRSRLIVLLLAAPADARSPDRTDRHRAEVGEDEFESLLGAAESWIEPAGPRGVLMRRA